jgi:aminoglycoside 6-adenylyltransferase
VNYEPESVVIDRLTRWGESQASVRAMVLTSSRAVAGGPVDILSDYDVVLAVTDVRPYYDDRAWLAAFGAVLVLYRDPLATLFGLPKTGFVTQYESGLKIDFGIWSVEILRQVATDPGLRDEFDAGYRILLDKDNLTDGLPAPTYHAYIPPPPTEDEYLTVVELFFHEATYVAKHLWRGDLMAAKYNLDHAMKQENLRPMLEWQVEIDHNWSVKPGPYGRRLRTWLAPALWAEIEGTYAGGDLDANWDAMFRTIDLFRKVAIAVGDSLGYAYPLALDDRAVTYLREVQALPR